MKASLMRPHLGFALLGAALVVSSAARADNGKVLILSPTVTGGVSSKEALAAGLAGLGVDVVTNAQWAAKTTADFADYRALVLGDATCTSLGVASAAIANATTWGAAISGNVMLIGTDPVWHAKTTVTNNGVAFAGAKPGKTGLYLTLSCYYHGVPAHTAVPLLNGLAGAGAFTVTGVGCFNTAHIVATSPALTGLTDAYLSGWSCSVHEAFDKWPADYDVLAIAQGAGTTYTASDGTVGIPYILAKGVTVISNIKLTPLTDLKNVGSSELMTATVTTDTPSPNTPVVGTTVTFKVLTGPDAGQTGTDVTNASGVATFTLVNGGTAGVDLLRATFVDSLGRTQTSNSSSIDFQLLNRPPVALCQNPTVIAGSSCLGAASVDNGSYDPDGDPITLSQVSPGPFPLGSTSPVTLTVTDTHAASSSCIATVTVVDRTRPSVGCPGPVTAYANSVCTATIPNVIPGVTASDNCTPSGALGLVETPAAGTVVGLGTFPISVTATDGSGNTGSCSTSLTVLDTTKPSISMSVGQGMLWPPNHDLINVGLTVVTGDNCTSTPLTGVTVYSNEAEEMDTGDGKFSPDAKNIANGTLRLRSERQGGGNGRVYLLVGKATDGSGNSATACSTVVVPQSQSAASKAQVNALAAAAQSYCAANGGAAPAGYIAIGGGAIIGPKQ